MSAILDFSVADVWGNHGIGWKSYGLMGDIEGSKLYADGVVFDRWDSDERLAGFTVMRLTIGVDAIETLGLPFGHKAVMVCDDFGQLVRVAS